MRKMFERLKQVNYKNYLAFFIYFGLIAVACIVLDQVSKYVAVDLLPNGEAKPFIPGFIDWYLTFNKGAAWGLGDGNVFTRILLVIVSWIVAFFIPGYVVLQISKSTKFDVMFGICLALIWGGDIGNLIDRTFFFERGVIDFISIQSWWPGFGIFNLADSFLVVGILALVVYFIIEEVKSFLEKRKENIAKEAEEKQKETENKDEQ